MDARSAAEAIRGHVDADHYQTRSADERHHHDWVRDVCGHLGLEANMFNMMHVSDVLAQAGINHPISSYPKMLTNDGRPILHADGPLQGQPVVFDTEDEEAAYMAAKQEKDDAGTKRPDGGPARRDQAVADRVRPKHPVSTG